MNEIGKRIIFESPGNAQLEDFRVREPKDKECVVKISDTLISNGTEKAVIVGLGMLGLFGVQLAKMGWHCLLLR